MQFPIARSRFVAVSATIPNARDIAEWLSVDTARGLHVFGEDYRPVRLVTHVRGYNMTKVWQRVMHRLFCAGSNCPFLLLECKHL
jgi:superfamily II RNA helicase